jgi:hypothetical protein
LRQIFFLTDAVGGAIPLTIEAAIHHSEILLLHLIDRPPLESSHGGKELADGIFVSRSVRESLNKLGNASSFLFA